ncbi:MAG: cytidine deaminase [Nesterenkonia sp.]|uniref:cytidine deaminase n=1 Tax=Nesterenkonia marinintestina TaxID=2979865 RepID=UPI0021BF3512|nr:cytidine deaminase [Nesterenkonia sp. GX14115]MDO5493621.1 cytidine deaminase [Nesterenkonia sp.]
MSVNDDRAEPARRGAPAEDDFELTGSLRAAADAGRIDWDALTTRARIAMTKAYAPYSGYPVGAAAELDTGTVVSGCNVENASYGVGLCAECTLVGQLRMSGGGRIAAFVCVDGSGELITPCGRCRQLLHEFAAETMYVRTARGVITMDELLPQAFGPNDLGVGDHADPGPRTD